MIPKDFENLHKDKTIYILGNGLQLAELTSDQIEKLKTKITIGMNYSQLIMNSTYWIGGHMICLAHYVTFYPDDTIPKFFQGDSSKYNIDFNEKHNIININSISHKLIPRVEIQNKFISISAIEYIVGKSPKYRKKNKINSLNEKINNVITGASNVGISATHLAYIMGANRIIYLGVDMKNGMHFYTVNEESLKNLYNQFIELKSKYKNCYELLKSLINQTENDKWSIFHYNINELKEIPYKGSPFSGFRKFINLFIENKIEVISTVLDSRLIELGAKYVSLDEVLEKY